MICNRCNNELPDHSEFCQYCGNKLRVTTEKNNIRIQNHIISIFPKNKKNLVIIISSIIIFVSFFVIADNIIINNKIKETEAIIKTVRFIDDCKISIESRSINVYIKTELFEKSTASGIYNKTKNHIENIVTKKNIKNHFSVNVISDYDGFNGSN